MASSNILLPADIPLANAPIKTAAGFVAAMDQVINAAPTGANLLAWLNAQVAGHILDRAHGDLKEAANILDLPLPELRKLLGGKS
ncbi:MAG: hypothetical protein HC767_07050 [Akkermansiaceae bacterium]|nr:hypothetical protein [Akkermansiaceae bacterium]